jgi:hypothetical protein
MTRAYVNSTRILGALLVVIGIAMVVVTLVRGGGPLAAGVLLGLLLAALGAGRVWLARDGGRAT